MSSSLNGQDVHDFCAPGLRVATAAQINSRQTLKRKPNMSSLKEVSPISLTSGADAFYANTLYRRDMEDEIRPQTPIREESITPEKVDPGRRFMRNPPSRIPTPLGSSRKAAFSHMQSSWVRRASDVRTAVGGAAEYGGPSDRDDQRGGHRRSFNHEINPPNQLLKPMTVPPDPILPRNKTFCNFALLENPVTPQISPRKSPIGNAKSPEKKFIRSHSFTRWQRTPPVRTKRLFPIPADGSRCFESATAEPSLLLTTESPTWIKSRQREKNEQARGLGLRFSADSKYQRYQESPVEGDIIFNALPKAMPTTLSQQVSCIRLANEAGSDEQCKPSSHGGKNASHGRRVKQARNFLPKVASWSVIRDRQHANCQKSANLIQSESTCGSISKTSDHRFRKDLPRSLSLGRPWEMRKPAVARPNQQGCLTHNSQMGLRIPRPEPCLAQNLEDPFEDSNPTMREILDDDSGDSDSVYGLGLCRQRERMTLQQFLVSSRKDAARAEIPNRKPHNHSETNGNTVTAEGGTNTRISGLAGPVGNPIGDCQRAEDLTETSFSRRPPAPAWWAGRFTALSDRLANEILENAIPEAFDSHVTPSERKKSRIKGEQEMLDHVSRSEKVMRYLRDDCMSDAELQSLEAFERDYVRFKLQEVDDSDDEVETASPVKETPKAAGKGKADFFNMVKKSSTTKE